MNATRRSQENNLSATQSFDSFNAALSHDIAAVLAEKWQLFVPITVTVAKAQQCFFENCNRHAQQLSAPLSKLDADIGHVAFTAGSKTMKSFGRNLDGGSLGDGPRVTADAVAERSRSQRPTTIETVSTFRKHGVAFNQPSPRQKAAAEVETAGPAADVVRVQWPLYSVLSITAIAVACTTACAWHLWDRAGELSMI